jgi:hypothetical protein
MSCKFCANNRTNPEWELDEEQVFYAMTVGAFEKGHRIMFNKAPYKPLEITFDWWRDDWKTPQYQQVGSYFPKYCPECGRKIDEYDRSKFDKYE